MVSVRYKTPSFVTTDDLQSLSTEVKKSGETSRLCYHQSVDSAFHMMLICLPKKEHYPVHRHMDSDETITILKGELTITIFDSLGKLEEQVLLQPLSDVKKVTVSILIQRGRWHSVKSGSIDASFLEIKQGPFDKAQMELLSEQNEGMN